MHLLRDPQSFKGDDVFPYLHANWQIPLTAVILYAVLVVGLGQLLMRNVAAFELKFFTRLWNAIVAAFSIIGALYCVPHLLQSAHAHGWRFTLCADPTWYTNGIPGLLTYIFMWSKFFELIDTVFLVLRKREVIFLHWYHHITVLLFCWMSFPAGLGFGFWFCTMNYYVHAIMYSYYFFMGFDLTRPLVRPFAQFITSLQIVQMLGGLAIILAASNEPEPCHRNEDVKLYGLIMYGSYLVLFCHFFYRTYIAKAKKPSGSVSGKAAKAASGSPVAASPTTVKL
jgi:elongation of very long chain fatty acids protein 6